VLRVDYPGGMSVLREIDAELAALERDLASEQGAPEARHRLRGRLARPRRRLDDPEAAWEGTTEVKHLLV
jgi:hypothetical protein